MQVIIRVDSSLLIGSGHIMRCLNLADKLKNEGHSITFLCRDLPGNCYEFINARAYQYHLLPFSEQEKNIYSQIAANDEYSTWLGVTKQQDADEVIAFVKDKTIDLLVTDIYALDIEWEQQIKVHIKKIMVIDDLANRYHECDILLDHNYYQNFANRYDDLVPGLCKKLLGPKYALLNPDLIEVKEARIVSGKNKLTGINTILVFLGGMDIKNHTDTVLEQLSLSNLNHCNIDVVLGKHNPNNYYLINKYAIKNNIEFHIQPTYYFDLMEQADLAISAGGVSALERLFIALPMIVICTAENQEKICHDLHTDKLAYYVEHLPFLSKILNDITADINQLNTQFNYFDEHLWSIEGVL